MKVNFKAMRFQLATFCRKEHANTFPEIAQAEIEKAWVEGDNENKLYVIYFMPNENRTRSFAYVIHEDGSITATPNDKPEGCINYIPNPDVIEI